MSSLYFDFEEGSTVDLAEVTVKEVKQPANRIEQNQISPSKLTIAQIQELLSKDIHDESALNESSFYCDEETIPSEEKKPPPKKPEGILKGIENVASSSSKPRKKAKAAKKADKEVKINDQVDRIEAEVFRTYKKPATTVLASIENTAPVNKNKTKKPKISKKDVENNENFEKMALAMNKRFAEVDNFELSVE